MRTKYIVFIVIVFICATVNAMPSTKTSISNGIINTPLCRAAVDECPTVPLAKNFDLDKHLGHWYIIETTLDLPDCAFADRTAIKSREDVKGNAKKRQAYGSYASNYAKGQDRTQEPLEEQQLLVNYFDTFDNTAKNVYNGKTTRMNYGGSSYRNTFTSGSVSDVKILYADYDPSCGYVLMITCTTQANGDFSVNANVLSRVSYLDEQTQKNFRSLLKMYGLTELESRLKIIDHDNCQPQPVQTKESKTPLYQQRTEY